MPFPALTAVILLRKSAIWRSFRASALRAAEILSVNGVEGAFVGPNDLSADYGCLGNPAAAEILRAIERVQRAAEKAGKRAGIITGNENYLERASACGYSMFCKGSELNAISEYCKAVVKSLNVE